MQAEYKNYKYKVVNIQNLPRKGQIQAREVNQQHLIKQLDKPTNQQYFGKNKATKLPLQESLLCYKDTATTSQRIIDSYHYFFSAFFSPYNNHGDVFLVPDDIWLMISLFLSKYIDKNAQKLRSQFVKHEGQKQLTIKQYAGSKEQAIKMQKQWDFFFKQIIKQIQKNTTAGTVEALACNFSTTDQVYKLISTSIIMSSFKSYFKFGRAICMCGINNAYFAGTRQDWVKVLEKLQNLNKYDVDGVLKEYVSKVAVIIKNFISTFDQKPDLQWWNTIMTSEQRRVGSGGQTDTYIQGWILHFYGIYQKVQAHNLPSTLVNVPIKLINQWTNTEKQLELISDWVSVSKINEYTYKPDIGMCILERSRKTIQ